jgi:Fic family protein
MYIRQQKGWPYLTWDNKELSYVLGEVRNRQGRLAGKTGLLGIDLKKEALLSSISTDILKSAELDGKTLDETFVQASVTRQLKIGDSRHVLPIDPAIDRVVQVTTDALLNYRQPVTKERIFKWKQALDNTQNGIEYRNSSIRIPVNIDNGHLYMEDSSLIPNEMKRFIKWINTIHPTDPVIKAGVAHLRFACIHPFDDGNDRIARTLADVFLTRADDFPQRLFSLSAQIYKQQDTYRCILTKVQTGSLDITEWLMWFLYCFEAALIEAENTLTHILKKSKFWEKYRLVRLNDRQVKIINLLWEGTNHTITSSCWANLNLCSPDTALRDIQDLIDKKILHKKSSGGRSTSYELN